MTELRTKIAFITGLNIKFDNGDTYKVASPVLIDEAVQLRYKDVTITLKNGLIIVIKETDWSK